MPTLVDGSPTTLTPPVIRRSRPKSLSTLHNRLSSPFSFSGLISLSRVLFVDYWSTQVSLCGEPSSTISKGPLKVRSYHTKLVEPFIVAHLISATHSSFKSFSGWLSPAEYLSFQQLF
ncbi:hypothetical protein CDL15_Pgr013339 [Punica granatum]|uniref:Uncharacterized protein n=1 Tax=Punica granatum TaxID=22663 RepID=A0A218WNR9_PUNGR|nr:hypothetical protein CDL15_Pgr013339 [Punica granatum]